LVSMLGLTKPINKDMNECNKANKNEWKELIILD
jgi:hypothetical protein